jgi:DtxR family transcriptional regulator, Mn-dependent transcriptional regulator
MLSERAEDYLEAVYVIRLKKGYVRVKDLALKLGVSGPSAIEMLKKLHEKRLVHYEKYGGITLTTEGEEIARAINDRHETLFKLLSIAGVPADVADRDACTIEHHLSPKSLEHLKKLVAALEEDPAKCAQGISIKT